MDEVDERGGGENRMAFIGNREGIQVQTENSLQDHSIF